MPEFDTLMQTYILPWGVNIGLAIVIFIFGRWLSKILGRVLANVLSRTKLDQMLVRFVLSIVQVLLTLVVVVASLGQLGVDTTSLIALVGAAGLAVGLALQDSLKNFAAGVLLIFFRPFKEGDFVEVAGVSGIAESITIFNTVMRTGDNREVIVPNGSIYSDTITNYNRRPTRRVDMVFGIGYDDDLRKAKELLIEIVKSDPRVLPDPEPVVAVSALADSSVNFIVRPWVKTEDYWATYWAVTEAVKLRFDEEGISIPYPQMDVHLKREG
ncbi:MAG TPA: mechanosensitive ion channel domain-containing protein [Marinobacterium sp.]|nr:mechanosensitive ion channel domain-containing protein [Marinobacterium sp.]